MTNKNKQIAAIFYEMAALLEIKGTPFKPSAYRRAAKSLEGLNQDVSVIYKEKVPRLANGEPGSRPQSGLGRLKEIPAIGESTAKKIEEYLKKGKIKQYQELQKETAIRQIVTHYFESKGLSLGDIKSSARKKKIIYSRFTRPAKQLLELAGSLKKAKEAITKVAEWANSRGLDYAIETVFKKWLELGRLKPKEIVKKPFFRGEPMVWSGTKRKWYVIDKYGDWLEFVGKEAEIEWKTTK